LNGDEIVIAKVWRWTTAAGFLLIGTTLATRLVRSRPAAFPGREFD
jgi:hypothetical protein